MTWEAGAARLLQEYDEEIDLLRVELIRVEALAGCPEHVQARGDAIRSRIKLLEFERDLLPHPRPAP